MIGFRQLFRRGTLDPLLFTGLSEGFGGRKAMRSVGVVTLCLPELRNNFPRGELFRHRFHRSGATIKSPTFAVGSVRICGHCW
ncbi:hypothetical protein ABIA23_000983 [Sinorhizobium fredii]